MEDIDAALTRRRYRKRPIRVDGLSDFEVDQNDLRRTRASLIVNKPLPWEAKSYGVYIPGKSFDDLAQLALRDERTLTDEMAKLTASTNYEGRAADISRLDAAIKKLMQSYEFRTKQDQLAAKFAQNKGDLITAVFNMKTADDDVPTQRELKQKDVEGVIRVLTEDMGATSEDVTAEMEEIHARSVRQLPLRSGSKQRAKPTPVRRSSPNSKRSPSNSPTKGPRNKSGGSNDPL